MLRSISLALLATTAFATPAAAQQPQWQYIGDSKTSDYVLVCHQNGQVIAAYEHIREVNLGYVGGQLTAVRFVTKKDVFNPVTISTAGANCQVGPQK